MVSWWFLQVLIDSPWNLNQSIDEGKSVVRLSVKFSLATLGWAWVHVLACRCNPMFVCTFEVSLSMVYVWLFSVFLNGQIVYTGLLQNRAHPKSNGLSFIIIIPTEIANWCNLLIDPIFRQMSELWFPRQWVEFPSVDDRPTFYWRPWHVCSKKRKRTCPWIIPFDFKISIVHISARGCVTVCIKKGGLSPS